MRTALIHEWFECFAGSERVVAEFLNIFREADLFAIVDFLSDENRKPLLGKPVTTSFIQGLPFARKAFRNFLPLMPCAIEQFDLSEYDIVLSSNHAFAKGVVTRADQLHLSYVHTPIRYAWDLQHDYLRQGNVERGVKSLIVRATMHYLRSWDRLAADRVDAFIANSRYIAQRIRKTYRRPAYVVYPPVDVNAFEFCDEKEDFYLTASRLVPYKRIDVVVDAFRQMPDKQLVVIGDGPERTKLESKATPNVKILGYRDFDELLSYMQRARAFVFAADEDFGIMPVEAQACGTPVIAYGRGGSRETVMHGQTGLHFDRQTPQSLVGAIEAFESHRDRFQPEVIRQHAERFSPGRFRREINVLVEEIWDRFRVHNQTPAAADQISTPFPFDPDQMGVELSSPIAECPTIPPLAAKSIGEVRRWTKRPRVADCQRAPATHSVHQSIDRTSSGSAEPQAVSLPV